jgi:hypothetical protein
MFNTVHYLTRNGILAYDLYLAVDLGMQEINRY